jgi:hypothetical protein
MRFLGKKAGSEQSVKDITNDSPEKTHYQYIQDSIVSAETIAMSLHALPGLIAHQQKKTYTKTMI